MTYPDIIIAIDGFSSTGKSTFARLIAARTGFLYLDSGALYRAITLYALEAGIVSPDGKIDEKALSDALDKGLDVSFKNTKGASKTYLCGRCVEKRIRSLKVSSHVSPVSAFAFVRAFVDEKLREFGRSKRIVMDGRDIGTTVFPNAEFKIFMTADDMVRARRRAAEMEAKGENVSLEDVLANIKERDYSDSHRKTSPLRKADDAIVLDNSYMTLDEQMSWFDNIMKEKFGNGSEC